jgi:putative nucleotidyltransferase with HDIG domain
VQVALVRIGLAASRDLLFQVVYERSNRELVRYQTEVEKSFDHSVRTAIAARCVAREMQLAYENAYLCGLLHDIGEARIYRILAKLPDAPDPGSFLSALVDAHHTRAGADVAIAWKLPRDISDVCTYHHAADGPALPAVLIVRAAEAIVNTLERAPLDEKNPMATLQPAELEPIVRGGIRSGRVPYLILEVHRQLSVGADSTAADTDPSPRIESQR